MGCKTIMIVEDDEEIRKSVEKALKFEGYSVVVANNGKMALEILNNLSSGQVPGCMILDLMMPEMDGLTLIKTIENNYKDKFGDIKILIATAKGSPVNQEMIPNTFERIQKPFELEELFRVVELHCGKPE